MKWLGLFKKKGFFKIQTRIGGKKAVTWCLLWLKSIGPQTQTVHTQSTEMYDVQISYRVKHFTLMFPKKKSLKVHKI